MRLAPAAILFLLVASPAAARLDAPNVVPITEGLTTAGQPTAASLATLKGEGYGTVIYLAPPGAPDAVREEPKLVRDQGLAFVNIPIRFDGPTPADFDALAAALAQAAGGKVLVHCQINLRASAMVFLHRVIVGKEPAETAYDSVARVWSPNPVWKAYIVSMLRRHGNDFEPY